MKLNGSEAHRLYEHLRNAIKEEKVNTDMALGRIQGYMRILEYLETRDLKNGDS